MEVTRRTVLASIAAAVVSPMNVLVPVSSTSPKKSKYGIVFDGVDDCIQRAQRDELAKAMSGSCFMWIVVTERGIESWNGKEFVLSNDLLSHREHIERELSQAIPNPHNNPPNG